MGNYCGVKSHFFDRFSTKLHMQAAKIMRNSVAFSVVFDEATDTGSEDNAELRKRTSLLKCLGNQWPK